MKDPKGSPKRLSAGKTLAIAWGLMAGYRQRFLLAIGAMLVGTMLRFLVPLVGSGTIDYALRANQGTSRITRIFRHFVEDSWLADHLWVAGLLMVLLTATAGVFNYLKGRLAAKASDGISRRLKNRLFNHLQHLPMQFHNRTETGDLVQRCTSDVETLRLAISTQVVDVSHSVILMGLAAPLMFFLDPKMAMASFILIGPIIIFGFFYLQKVRFLFLQFDQAEGRVTSIVQENLAGLRVVRAFRRQRFEIDKFSVPNREYRDAGLRLVRQMAVYWSISDAAALAQNAIVLGLGIHLISTGSLTVGTLFAFVMLLNLILWPVRQMGRTLTELGKSFVAIGRIQEILDEPVETGGLKPETPASQGHLVARDLTFAHREGQAALNGVSFEVRPGETLAVMGPTGSGKSTLLHVLLRLYDYQGGSLRLDGFELRDLDPKYCRRQFSTVMQEPFLFSKTIVDNIKLGRAHAHVDEITEAAQMAHIHETIGSFPAGYQTLVGERGITLSGGQRQRVALARALLREAPILLLDDALSAVDTETEETILNALKERHGKMTTIVIAHRLSTLAHADRVMVLDEGRVVQAGTPDELYRREGLYRRLWRIQNQMEAEVSGEIIDATEERGHNAD